MEEHLLRFKNNPRPRAKNILDLDDSCIIHLFSLLNPLPDLFNAARSCKRFRDLVHTRRSWLIVTSNPGDIPIVGVPQEYRQQFTSLADAITASRPGDTILLEPGIHEASNLVISHPLQIIGDGTTADSCCLRSTTKSSSSSAASRAAPVLNFAATAGKVSNLAIEGGIGGCIAHYKGKLALEDCSLKCDDGGLAHLAAPLVSFACSTSTAGVFNTDYHSNAVKVEAEEEIQQQLKAKEEKEIEEEPAAVGKIVEPRTTFTAAAVGTLSPTAPLIPLELEKEEEKQQNCLHFSSGSFFPCAAAAAAVAAPAGPGLISVVGCSLQGGSTAVKVRGTGAVHSVRVIYEAHKALFWFDVDSAAVMQVEGQEEHQRGAAAAACIKKNVDGGSEKERKNTMESTILVPSWVDNKLGAGFDPKALQTQIAAAAAGGRARR